MNRELEITPLTRIGELLEAYPELEAVLIECAPVFNKLKNPVLRRTVARVATVQKAASVAGLDVGVLTAKLRRAAGQSVDDDAGAASPSMGDETCGPAEQPAWVDASKVDVTLDADALLEAGQVPVGPVIQAARKLTGDQALRVTSTFRPVPLIEALQRQGFRVFLRQAGPDRFETFIA